MSDFQGEKVLQVLCLNIFLKESSDSCNILFDLAKCVSFPK